MVFSRAEATEQFLLGISYDHAPPTFDMKIIIFPSHPIINEILKLQKMNLLEMKNTTISPKNSTTKTNYTIEVFKKIKLCKFKAIKRVAVKFDYIYIQS